MSRSADEFLARRPDVLERERRKPAFIRLAAWLAGPLALYFRFRGEGLERLPAGGCVLVANHSSGAVFEIWLLVRWWRRVQGDRPVRGLMHRIAFEVPLKFAPIGPWLGGVIAHPEAARRALARDEALLVFPGGDLDACRSFGDRYRVVFGGRAGFARVAREASVPIVPVALTGAHACYWIPFGTRRLASLLRLDRRGLKALPLSFGLILFLAAGVATAANGALWPLAVAAFVQMLVPLPTRIHAEALEPIVPGADESDADVAERVRASIERAVVLRAAERLTPWG